MRGDKLPKKSDNALVQPDFNNHIKLIAQKSIRVLNEHDLNYLRGNHEKYRDHGDINACRDKIIEKIRSVHSQLKNLPKFPTKLGCCTIDKIIAQI